MEKEYDYEKMSVEGHECDCAAAGFCPLLGREMNDHLHNLCKTDPRYRSLFLETAQKKGIHDVEVQRKFNQKNIEQSELYSKADAAIREMKEAGISLDEEGSSVGLGDTISKVLSKFGITQEKIEKLAGAKGCGCSKRKEWFNKVFSYNKEEE